MLAWIVGAGIVAIVAFSPVIAVCVVKIVDLLQDCEDGCEETDKGKIDESNA